MPHVPTIFDFLPEGVPAPVATMLLTLAITLLLGAIVAASLRKGRGIVPAEKLTPRNILELLLEGLTGQMAAVIGPEWRRFAPVVCTLGLFILISNLTGLVPFFTGPTSFIETNLAWAAISFGVYNYAGIRHHGAGGYLKHFMGPVPWLAPLMFPIELISHASRLLSLTVRLTANMFADHTLVAIFLSLPVVNFIAPSAMMGLGLFVAFLQAFIFAYLTAIYIGQAVEDAH
ncbi:MAG: F0F1 ATP synthase subunit A [bacterium]|nr:F0F1 ATP synthase subunit A [bacterium]